MATKRLKELLEARKASSREIFVLSTLGSVYDTNAHFMLILMHYICRLWKCKWTWDSGRYPDLKKNIAAIAFNIVFPLTNSFVLGIDAGN